MVSARRVLIPSHGRELRGVFVRPEGEGAVPGVLVFHEAYGLNEDIEGQCRRLAELGYAALAPDLYSGRGPRPFCVVRVMRELGRARGTVFDDLEAARRWLAGQPGVLPDRIGVIGFCMGGGFALLFAARAPLRAAGVFYGAVPASAEELRGVCPVVAGYGGRDRMFRRYAERLERHLTELGVEHDIRVYPEAGHSYMNVHRGFVAWVARRGPLHAGYDREAAEDSWRRVAEFFGRHLRGESSPGGSGP